MGILDKVLVKGAEKAGLLNKPVFHSAVDAAAEALKRGKGTGQEFLTEIAKTPGVKKAEIVDRGLDKLKDIPKMTKADLLNELKSRPAPKVSERELKHATEDDVMELAEQKANDADWSSLSEAPDVVQNHLIEAARNDLERAGPNAEFEEKYTIPGGENYREILLKLPNKAKPSKFTSEVQGKPAYHYGTAFDSKSFPTAEERDAFAAANPYQEPFVNKVHFPDPNILAFMRVKDRTGPNGEKILHIEELQSDWHQQGREKGYGSITPEQNKERAKLLLKMEEEDGLLPQDMERLNELMQLKSGVPDAPFKKNWEEMALKRAMKYAADNGYEGIAITPGAEQASRYDLSNQVNQIIAAKDDGGFRIFARDNQGKNHDMGIHATDSLGGVVGKDLAQKIASQTKASDIYEGVDLKVGGEGMNVFYDQKVPNLLNDIGKTYGSKVELGAFPVEGINLHYMPLNPEAREQIKGGTMPLYQQIGIPTGAGAAGAEAISQEDQDRGYAVGGPVGSPYDTTPDMHDAGGLIQSTAFKKGGKVKFNPHNIDHMFMEVNDQKFKRK